MKVGDKIWRLDPRSREKHIESQIISETSWSWILAGGWDDEIELSKKALAAGELFPAFARSLEEVAQAEWVDVNGWRIVNIVDSVRFSKDYAKLKAIAKIIGYKEGAK